MIKTMAAEAVAIELEANQAQVQRIVQSKAFRTSEVHRNLLQYLAEKSLSGTADSLKEYTVGLDVFSKPASYDPRQESVVRMHVARLRQKLAEYYRTEGLLDPVIVDVPKGGFRVTFETREVAPPALTAAPLDPTPHQPIRRKEAILAGLLALAVVCALAFGIQTSRFKPGRPAGSLLANPDVQQIWGPILNTNRPLMICLPAQNGDAEASGAFLLGQFLASRKDNVLLTRSDQLAMPEVLMDNVIFLGPFSGNRQIEALAKGQPLVLEPGGIRNLNPLPGEPAFIADSVTGSKEIDETHALISHVPGLYGNGDILYLAANQTAGTQAAVRALTDPALARDLIGKLKPPTGALPRFYQMVLRVRSMDGMPIAISYLFHRNFTPVRKP